MAITVRKEMLIPASGKAAAETRYQLYLDHDGLKRREIRSVESQSDTTDFTEYRDSDDNGRTWGEWVREKPLSKEKVGNDEMEEGNYSQDQNVWNPVHRHYITVRFHTIYVGGYQAATDDYWSGGQGPVSHTFIEIESEDKARIAQQYVRYEEGAEFDKAHYHETDFLTTNFCIGTGLTILENGDIMVGLWVPVDVCCRRAGLDVKRISPSLSRQPNGLLACRGTWNAAENRYDLSFSEPIILDDRLSSRGMSEPIFAELKSGKILLILRASNVRVDRWGSRISPYAPGYKLYSLSENGGRTFAPPMPWHFNTREVIYSPATYSLFLRSRTNGKLYWFGNITDPTKTSGNYPRYPIQVVEIDENWGCAKKDTLTVIETRQEGESELVQLSNFALLQDRETGDVELYLTKLGQFDGRNDYDCEVWRFFITLPADEKE